MAGHAYKSAVDELDAGVGRDLVSNVEVSADRSEADCQDAPFRATVLEPVGRMNNYYGTINTAITKRNHKVWKAYLEGKGLTNISDDRLRCRSCKDEALGRQAFRGHDQATKGKLRLSATCIVHEHSLTSLGPD
jgi:hypothetical protein